MKQPLHMKPEKASSVPTDTVSDANIPSAEIMLERLYSVDIEQFDSEKVFAELKGKQLWISAMTIPFTVIVLALFILLGLLFDHPIIGFLIGALLLYWVAKMIDHRDIKYHFEAKQTVMRRIHDTEGDFGLVPHFKHFLPSKYRHLWQSLKKGNYRYIKQYIQAIHILQHQIDPDKFTHLWHLNYPQLQQPAVEEQESQTP